MIKYSNQLQTYDFDFKRNIKKGVKVKSCLDIMTFDIEVSSAWLKDDHLIPYSKGKSADYWNDLDKYALPYIWQFSLNDKVYYGRELKSFLNILKDIPDDLHCLIWVHNLAYEFEFLINILTVESVFARAPHKAMKCVFKDFPNIEFRCTYFLTNLSLEKWGEQLSVHKKVGDLDYITLRTPLTPLTDKELDYCEYDCLVVYEGIKDHLKKYKDVWDIPLTSTGKVRRKVKKLVTNDDQYMRDIKRCIPKDADEYKRLQQVFAGGYTHGNRKFLGEVIKGPVYHKDIASSYPYVLCAYKFPYNRWAYVGKQLPDPDTFEMYAYIIKVRFKNLKCISWNTYISASKCRGSGFLYDNGRILKADELTTIVTEQDFITIINNYTWDEIECEGCWKCVKSYLPKIFVDFILDLYKDKTELKGLNDPVAADKYAISKQYINAMFGLAVQAIFQEDINFDQESDMWNIGKLTADKVNDGLEKLKVWYNKKYFLSYSVGCWCTAYARRRIISCIEELETDPGCDPLYCDTDSVFYIGKHDFKKFNDETVKRMKIACKVRGINFNKTMPKDTKGKIHPLGILDDESVADEFKFLGAKKYLEKRDDKLYMTVAGINKGAVDCLNDIDSFKDGFIFDKDSEHVHKLEHTYLSDMKPITWPDGYKSDFKYGINMRPTGYKLSTPNIYKDALEIMETGNLYFTDYFISRRRGHFK